jgi:hypothetical protein
MNRREVPNALFLAVLFTASLALSVMVVVPQKAEAVYDGGSIIANKQFLDSDSMSKAQIQSFLESKNSGIATREYELSCYGSGSQERQWYEAAGATCDMDVPASEIIYYAAQIYGISPRVILSTLQKEQSLITTQNPTSWQISQAMGYACPTSGSCSSESNFSYQIDSGTWVLRYHYERANGNMNWWNSSTSWTCGTEKNFYKPNLYPGQNVRFYDQNDVKYRTHFIENAATSSLYCYTPHAYNNPDGLYGRNTYGTTGLYYSGSYNFVYWFEAWFGSTQSSTDFKVMKTPRWLELSEDINKIDPFSGDELGSVIAAGTQIYFKDVIKVDGELLLRTKNDTDLYLNKVIPVDLLGEIPVVYSPMVSPRWMTTTKELSKIDPLTREKVGDSIPSGTTLYFPTKTTIGGSVYLRTEADTFNGGVRTAINISSLEDTSLVYVPLEMPRWFNNISETKQYDLKYPKGTASELIEVDTKLYFDQKVKLNGTWYLTGGLTGPESWSGTPLSHLEGIDDLSFKSLKNQRAYSLNTEVKKIDLKTGQYAIEDAVPSDAIVFFETLIILDGNIYLRSSNDTDKQKTTVIGITLLTPIEVVFEDMTNPRVLSTTKLLQKRDPVTLQKINNKIPRSTNISFSQKMKIGNTLYLRTANDTENGHYRVIPLSFLKEL